jgi:hypothetical protein
MHFAYGDYRLIRFLLCGALALCGCASTATVVDRSDTKTTVKNPRMEYESDVTILIGGAVRSIPLEDIRMVKIDATRSVNYERQIFYSAQVILKDGSVLSEAGSDSTFDRQCYIGVQGVLVGKRGKERFRIPLLNVQQIKMDD